MKVTDPTSLTPIPERTYVELEEFIVFACDLMRNRLVGDQIADAMGWNRDELRNHVLASQASRDFQKFLFARIVPNLKKLGLLTPRVREAFQKLDIIQFEDFDPTETDRRLGFA